MIWGLDSLLNPNKGSCDDHTLFYGYTCGLFQVNRQETYEQIQLENSEKQM
jgi:hypothetical protein